MIIVAIIALSAVVLTAVYATFIGLPSFPDSAVTALNEVIAYLGSGASYVLYFTNGAVVRALIRLTIAYEVVVLSYKFVMWIAKKIPMFGVSD